jgi:hypothetical protein
LLSLSGVVSRRMIVHGSPFRHAWHPNRRHRPLAACSTRTRLTPPGSGWQNTRR